jgi:hypothetical protein
MSVSHLKASVALYYVFYSPHYWARNLSTGERLAFGVGWYPRSYKVPAPSQYVCSSTGTSIVVLRSKTTFSKASQKGLMLISIITFKS